MATATENSASQYSEAENPKKTLTLTLTTPNLPDLTDDSNNSSTKSDFEPLNGASDASLEGAVNNKEADESKVMATQDTHSTGNSNDIQKKLRRAERFGVPVQLSEQEKRNSRAERFGMGGGSESSKTNEEQKRKARAERFGLSVSADEEGKKKARLARFGSDTKTDMLEEEKRKARALRFAQKPPSNDVSHINGKEDDVSNTAIAGNTSFDQSRVAIGVSGSVLSSCNRQLGVNAESKLLEMGSVKHRAAVVLDHFGLQYG